MPDKNKIKQFTATDIERYQKGMMSSKEKHELEKAALEDPFLADAIEGYSSGSAKIPDDIVELQKRLDGRIENEKAKSIFINRYPGFTWWRVAAVLIVLAGAGFLVYQFTANRHPDKIAENKPAQSQRAAVTDSVQKADMNKDVLVNTLAQEKMNKPTVNRETTSNGMGRMKRDTEAFQTLNKEPVRISSAESLAEKNSEKDVARNDEVFKNDLNVQKFNAQRKMDESASVKKLPGVNASALKDKAQETHVTIMNKTNAISGNMKQENLFRNYVFRGQVTDKNNIPIPFANITNLKDSSESYADAKGYFTLTSPDSSLDVRIQSLGFSDAGAEFHSRDANNKVVLQEDKSISAAILSKKKPNYNRFGVSILKADQTEPLDGWNNYDAYLANNLRESHAIRMKADGGSADISFEVGKDGRPVNFKVEKPLCKECDTEAIRLIKDGPKWISKSMKSRVTVIVQF
ncbi:MAG: carboxypeptidase-like regulatory domain-containing protein [Bacteroidetes bacterium]|nr:carboxypeptidase-like regulatory domain-containing protein [Bacteroidota bacterium]MBS1932201.1 carboxypeptidase-like regulatory domain-containing protein [Bacteroidota bacterium]